MKMLLDDTLLDGVTFREVDPGKWLVLIDDDTRTITKDERGFIAWIGHMDRHWNFDHALRACIDDSRYQRLHAKAVMLDRLDREALLQEQQRLTFSDADNASARLAEVNARLETVP